MANVLKKLNLLNLPSYVVATLLFPTGGQAIANHHTVKCATLVLTPIDFEFITTAFRIHREAPSMFSQRDSFFTLIFNASVSL